MNISFSNWLHAFKRLIRYLTTGWRYKLLNVLLLVLTPAIIGVVVWAEWDTLAQVDWEINLYSLGISFALLLFDMLLGAYNWHLVFSKLTGFNKAKQSIKIWWFSNLARRIPSPVWYIASRSIMYKKQGVSEKEVSLISGLEFALIFASGLIVFILSLPFWSVTGIAFFRPNQRLLIIPFVLLAVLLMHPKLILRFWQSIADRPVSASITWRDSIQWITGYIVVWCVGGLVFFYLINAFEPIPIQYLIPVIGMWALGSIVSMLGSLFIFIGALRELSIVFFLSYLLPLPVAIAIGILLRILWLLGELFTALLSLLL